VGEVEEAAVPPALGGCSNGGLEFEPLYLAATPDLGCLQGELKMFQVTIWATSQGQWFR